MTEVPSPCINICELDQSGEYCLGCGRLLDEIARWQNASNLERRAILKKLPERLLRLNGKAEA
ncbi:MAG: DUF1289 domain-containing protein [Sphingorhabdus sp.]